MESEAYDPKQSLCLQTYFISDSQQPISPIGFLFLKFWPPSEYWEIRLYDRIWVVWKGMSENIFGDSL